METQIRRRAEIYPDSALVNCWPLTVEIAVETRLFFIPCVLPFEWVLVAAMFVMGFGLGAYLLDYLQRRRHGGFRL